MLIVLQTTVRELVHRRHIKSTVGTTLKGCYRIVQYRIIQYIDVIIYIQTLTQGTGEDRIRDMEAGRSASGRKLPGSSMMIYVSPISSKTLRGASASCR